MNTETKHTYGCGQFTHVAGTNGGKMPCGELLKWPDGGQARILCAACHNAAELNVPEQFASAPELAEDNARLRAALESLREWLKEPLDYQTLDDSTAWALNVARLALAEGSGR